MAIDFTTSAGRVRMLISDTTEGSFIMTDAEITAALSMASDNVYTAAAIACRAIAASAAKSAASFSFLAGEVSIEKDNLPKWWLQLADKYEAMAALNDTNDYRVQWPVLINKTTGNDESDYADDDNSNYFDVDHQDGEE